MNHRKRPRDEAAYLLYGYDPDLPVLEGDPRLFPGRGLGTAWHPSQPVRNEWTDWGNADKAVFDFRVRRVLPVAPSFAGEAVADAFGARLAVAPLPELAAAVGVARPPVAPRRPGATRLDWNALGLGHAFGSGRARASSGEPDDPTTPAASIGALANIDHGCGTVAMHSRGDSTAVYAEAPPPRDAKSLPRGTGAPVAAAAAASPAAAAAPTATDDGRQLLDPLAPWNVALIRALAESTREAARRREAAPPPGPSPPRADERVDLSRAEVHSAGRAAAGQIVYTAAERHADAFSPRAVSAAAAGGFGGTSVSPRAHSPSAVSGISASVSVVLARRAAARRQAGAASAIEEEGEGGEDDDQHMLADEGAGGHGHDDDRGDDDDAWGSGDDMGAWGAADERPVNMRAGGGGGREDAPSPRAAASPGAGQAPLRRPIPAPGLRSEGAPQRRRSA